MNATSQNVSAAMTVCSGDSRRPRHIATLLCVLLFCVTFCLHACRAKPSTTSEIDASLATTAWLEEHYGFEPDPSVRALLQRVSKRLASSVYGAARENESKAALQSDLLHYEWEVIALQSAEINAFSVGTGIIFVTTGLLLKLHSESELAAILAHEMAHQLLGHSREATANAPNESKQPAAHFSLDYELDADALGLKIMSVARYHPTHALSAITLHDRNISKKVAGDDPQLQNKEAMTVRYAALQKLVSDCNHSLPTVGTTREFTRMQRRLAGG